VGAFPTDESPYGVRDLAGSMRSWACDIHGELNADAALEEREPAPGTPRENAGMRIVRGGAWFDSMQLCRSDSRFRDFATSRYTGFGLRLARPLFPRPTVA